jgi:hypothetical protein
MPTIEDEGKIIEVAGEAKTDWYKIYSVHENCIMTVHHSSSLLRTKGSMKAFPIERCILHRNENIRHSDLDPQAAIKKQREKNKVKKQQLAKRKGGF